MKLIPYSVIDMKKTGQNIQKLREERGLTVKDVQRYFNFKEPQSIYRWQSGNTLPSADHLLALSFLLDVKMEDILVFSTQSYPNAPAQLRRQNVISLFSLMMCA